MKIVCESCAAKYSIADEKVAGKMFKIRCKKCSAIMVVRCDLEPLEQAAPMRDDALGLRASRAGGGDLFAQSDAHSRAYAGDDEDDGVVSSAAAFTSPAAAPTGQRNESSVLFSLANLRALGTGTPARSDASARASQALPKNGMAADGGSGLIDIRALASASGLGCGAAQSQTRAVDELLSIGSSSSPFVPTLGAPMLAPSTRSGGNRGWLAGVAVGLVAVIAATAVVVVVVARKGTDAPSTTIASLGAEANAPGGVLAPAAGSLPLNASPPASVEARHAPTAVQLADSPTLTPTNVESHVAATHRSEVTTPAHTRGRETPPHARETPTTATTPHATTEPTNHSIEELLDRVGSHAEPAHSTTSPERDVALPTQPGRDQVRASLAAVQTALSACGAGAHGLALTAVTVSGTTGRVTNAVVSGQFAGTPVGSCVARAARDARFPRFANATFSVSFPFRI